MRSPPPIYSHGTDTLAMFSSLFPSTCVSFSPSASGSRKDDLTLDAQLSIEIFQQHLQVLFTFSLGSVPPRVVRDLSLASPLDPLKAKSDRTFVECFYNQVRPISAQRLARMGQVPPRITKNRNTLSAVSELRKRFGSGRVQASPEAANNNSTH